MVYLEKFVAVVKCKGKILREHSGVVSLPFGAEYSLLLKNLSNKRALVKIEIDGREVTGGGLIIPHTVNNVVELERFADSEDLSKGYKFKFIQKTKDVQDHRGDKLDDGLIKVEWWFEDEEPVWVRPTFHRYGRRSDPWRCSGDENARGMTFGTSMMSLNSVVACSASPTASMGDEVGYVDDSPLVDEGITVEGSDSDQKFVYGSIGRLDPNSHVVVFQLKGFTEKKETIKQPVYVDDKVQCKQCGRKWKSSQKFCGHCGARLIL